MNAPAPNPALILPDHERQSGDAGLQMASYGLRVSTFNAGKLHELTLFRESIAKARCHG